MGQCFCTLCTVPICCVSTFVVSQTTLKDRQLSKLGGILVSVGSTLFGFLTYFCGGLNFYGNNACWSEGQAEHFWLGVLAAFGLGIGFSILFYTLARSIRNRNRLENDIEQAEATVTKTPKPIKTVSQPYANPKSFTTSKLQVKNKL